MGIRIQLKSEAVCLGEKATICVYDDDERVAEISAVIWPQVGADGESYPGVKLLVSETRDPSIITEVN